MRSTLNGPISSRTAFNVAGATRMMASRDGREVASAISFFAVGIHYNYNIKSRTHLQLERLYQQCVSLAVLTTPPVLSTRDRLVVHVYEHLPSRKMYGLRVQNCRSRWYRAYIPFWLICFVLESDKNTPLAVKTHEVVFTTSAYNTDDA